MDMDNEILNLLSYELGEIHIWEEQCPGVLYLSVLPTVGLGGEYYAIMGNAPVSQEIHAMGRRLGDAPVQVYQIEAEDGAWAAVEYEILRYKTLHGLPMPEGKTLREAALFGSELRPDYFGAYPVPFLTPWGHTLRHRLLDNGVYWIETEQCVDGLAVCYPVWNGELSEGLQKVGLRLDVEGELGYLYFLRDAACAAVWELLWTRPALVSTGLILKPELMNAIWEYQPGYALGYNNQEQAGLHDALGLLLYVMGVEDRELEGSPDHMITITPNTGTNFIGFWR